MLNVSNLTLSLARSGRTIIRNFSFTPREGEKIALIGEEGNGKSSLLALIHDPHLVENYIEYSGEISKSDSVTGYLPQQLPPRFSDMPFWEYMYAENDGADYQKIARLAGEFSLSGDITDDRLPIGSASGGEKIKIQLVKLLSADPDILLLDEPSNDLDISSIVWLEDFIKSSPKTVIYISHDEVLLENTAQCIIHIEQIMRRTEPRHSIMRMPYSEYISRRAGMIEKSEAVAKEEKAAFDKKMERYRRIYDSVRVAQSNISRQNPSGGRLLKKKMHSVKSMEKRFEREREGLAKKLDSEEAIMIDFPEVEVPRGKIVLDVDIPVLYAGGQSGEPVENRILAEDIRFTLRGGDKLVITGPNGCGKTTLIREIEKRLRQNGASVAYMPQNYEDAMPRDLTPAEYLTESGDRSEDIRNRTYLGSIKFTPSEMDMPIHGLSGGQRAKLYFLKMILSGADTLLLDEPTRNLSPMSNPVIRRILRAYGGTIIGVSHDRKFIEEVFDTEYEMGR